MGDAEDPPGSVEALPFVQLAGKSRLVCGAGVLADSFAVHQMTLSARFLDFLCSFVPVLLDCDADAFRAAIRRPSACEILTRFVVDNQVWILVVERQSGISLCVYPARRRF